MNKIVTHMKEDILYKSMLEAGYTVEEVQDAGYDNRFSLHEYPVREGIPVHKLRQRLQQNTHNKPITVLYYSGGFNPFHEGHLTALISAKTHLEKSGMFVALAYIAPDHQAYVDNKVNFMTLPDRIKHIQKLTSDISDWVEIDLYPSKDAYGPLNFTTSLLSVKRILDTIIDTQYSVHYVYGEDNYLFKNVFETPAAKTMNLKGICISRDGLKEGILYHENSHISSTQKRETCPDLASSTKFDKEVYYIRNDLAFIFPKMRKTEKDNVLRSIVEHISSKIPEGVKIEIVDAGKEISGTKIDGLTISLDKYFQGTCNISVSRLYEKYSVQDEPVGLYHLLSVVKRLLSR